MSRYINCLDALSVLAKELKIEPHSIEYYKLGAALGKVPVAEVRPVIHAHWIVYISKPAWPDSVEGFYQCSNCGYVSRTEPHEHCPKCLADMDESEVKVNG